ncbi:UPF0182 family protein, partial [Bacillus sp. S34]|nr:UPF0182 family protein [Bacillus sp. S34]
TEDTVIAVRDIDLDGLSSQANTPYNRAFVYTHGYGVTAAFGNQRASDGKPVFLESGIPSNGALGDFQQRVYFGETSPAYSIVGAPKGTGVLAIRSGIPLEPLLH